MSTVRSTRDRSCITALVLITTINLESLRHRRRNIRGAPARHCPFFFRPSRLLDLLAVSMSRRWDNHDCTLDGTASDESKKSPCFNPSRTESPNKKKKKEERKKIHFVKSSSKMVNVSLIDWLLASKLRGVTLAIACRIHDTEITSDIIYIIIYLYIRMHVYTKSLRITIELLRSRFRRTAAVYGKR